MRPNPGRDRANSPSRHVTLIDPKLQELADCGIAIHHAGLEYADRRAIETAFREGQLYLIVSTSVSDRYTTFVDSE